MGQQEVLDFLKSNIGSNFTVEELEKSLSISYQNVYRALSKLEKTSFVTVKTIIAPNNLVLKTYSYKLSDELLDDVVKEFESLKNEARFNFINGDHLLSFMLIKEIKKLREMMEEWKLNQK